jgi:hypothetical protein
MDFYKAGSDLDAAATLRNPSDQEIRITKEALIRLRITEFESYSGPFLFLG